jgi:site-specific DNA-methyltransferase (adenine-specific)
MTPSGRIIQGDCLKVLPTLVDECADLVLTDPPYLVDYHDRSGRSIAGDKNGGWLKPAFAEISRVMKDGTFCVCFYGWNRSDEFMAAWRAAGLRPVGHLVWIKDYESSHGVLSYHHESAYLLLKGQQRPAVATLSDILPWHYTGNKLHPTQKPVPSLKPVIETFCPKGGLVLDPFCGSGSTLLAAKILGRRYLGIELEAKYADIAKARLEQKGSR